MKISFAFLLAIIILSIIGCSDSSTSPTDNSSNDYYFTATINGQSVSYKVATGSYQSSAMVSYGDLGGYDNYKGFGTSSIFSPSGIFTNQSAEVSIIREISNYNSKPSKSDFLGIINNGDYLYFPIALTVASPCVQLIWKDENGKQWNSAPLSSKAPDEIKAYKFTITSFKSIGQGTFGEKYRIEGTFSGKLWSSDGKNSIPVTNGSFAGQFYVESF